MKPEGRVEEITKSLIELAPSDRESYLNEVCADDEDLRREVLTSFEQRFPGLTTTPMENTAPAVHLQPDEFIGPYRIIRLLGKGGMGDVYLAEHMGQNREVALKMLPADFLADQQRVQRFRQEARAVMTLNHPNVVTVYDMGVSESGYFISTEFVEGETLRARMSRERLSLKDTVEIAEQIAGALAYAHERGVFNRWRATGAAHRKVRDAIGGFTGW
jgi:eukaryotic-like serine/threonine-protein kinase